MRIRCGRCQTTVAVHRGVDLPPGTLRAIERDLEPCLGAKWLPVSYRVVLERDEPGSWIAHVPAVPGCHTHGRSLVEARRRVREALSLWVDDAESAELVDDVRLPRDVLSAVRQSNRARARLTNLRAEASSATFDAVTRLDSLGLGVRDAAYLLGLSFQRVQQVSEGPRP